MVTICTIRLTFSNSTFCPRSIFMYFVWIWEQTAIISLYSIKWLVFITETGSVYCAVRTEWRFFVRNLHVLVLPRKQLHTTDWRSGSCVWTPGCCIEVRRHPKGSATCRIDTGFPCLTSVLEQYWDGWEGCLLPNVIMMLPSKRQNSAHILQLFPLLHSPMNVHEEWRQLHYFELSGHLRTSAIWSQGKGPPVHSR